MGRTIKELTGQRSAKLTIKLFLDVDIGGIVIKLKFFVVPKLRKDSFFDYDSQKHIGMLLDTTCCVLTLTKKFLI